MLWFITTHLSNNTGKKKQQKERHKKKCATFSRTIELSYPNNNLDNKSMLVVPVIHSHTSLSVRIDMHMASNENLCPIYPNTLKTHHQRRFSLPLSFYLQLNCSDLDLFLSISSIIWLHNKSKNKKL